MMLNVESITLIWQVATLILGTIILWNPTIRALTLFQAAHFNLRRYTSFVIDKSKLELRSIFYYLLLGIPYILMVNIANDSHRFSLLVFPSLLYIFVSFYRASKFSSIYFTSQMKRYLLAYVIITGLVVIMGVKFLPVNYYGIFMGFLFVYSWLAIYLIWLILYPVEKILEQSLLKKVELLLADSTITLVVSLSKDYHFIRLLDKTLSLKYRGYSNGERIGTYREVLDTIITKIRPYDEYCLLYLDDTYTDEIVMMLKQLPIKYVVVNDVDLNNRIQSAFNNPEYTIFVNNEFNQFSSAEVISHSLAEEASYRTINEIYSLTDTKFSLLADGNEHKFETKHLGRSKLQLLVFVISIANTLGVSIVSMQKAFRFLPDDNNIDVINTRQRTIINDKGDNHIDEISEMVKNDKHMKALVTACRKDDFQYLLGNDVGFDICIIDTSKLSKKLVSSVDKQKLWDRNIYLVSSEEEASRKVLELTNNDDIVLFKNTVIGNKKVLM